VCPAGAGTGMRDPELVETSDRGHDRRLAVIDVVGDADGMYAGRLQRFPRHPGVGEKAFVLDGMPAGRPVETAFEVEEHDVGGAELVADKGKGYGRVGDVHQVDVTGEDHFCRHLGHPFNNVRQARKPADRTCSPATGIAKAWHSKYGDAAFCATTHSRNGALIRLSLLGS